MTRYLSLMATLGLLLGACASAGGVEAHPPSTELAAAAADHPAVALRQPPPTTTSTTTTAPPTTTTQPPPPPTTAPPPPPTTAPPPPPVQVQPATSGSCGGYGDPANDACWHRLAQCESGGNWAINTGNGYYGGLQFSLSSWRAEGGTGYPHQHSAAEQIARGRALHAQGGWRHWPGCSRSFGWI